MLVCVIVMVPLKCVEQHFNAGLCLIVMVSLKCVE